MPSLRNSQISTEDSMTEVCAWQPRRDGNCSSALRASGLFAALLTGTGTEEEIRKIELLLKQAHASLEDRKVVPASLQKEKETEGPAAALELTDGRMIFGKTSELLGASSALLLYLYR